MIRLPGTRSEKAAAGDPRSSLEELYEDHWGYVLRVAIAAMELYQQRLYLWDDVYRVFNEAAISNVLLDPR